MSSFSTPFCEDVLKAITGQATSILSTTPLTVVYVALFTDATTMTDDTIGTEVSGGSYARVDTLTAGSGSATVWSTPTDAEPSVVTNSANGGTITFAAATANWGTIKYVALMDHATNATIDDVLCWDEITTKAIDNGDTAEIAASAFTITLD